MFLGTRGGLPRKNPLKPKDVWAIRVRLQLEHRKRDLALFNLAIDSKLRGCDLVRLQVDDVCAGGRVRDRATIIQKKTGRRSRNNTLWASSRGCPICAWLSRMFLLGFGSAWGRSSAIDETDRKALSVRDRPASVVPRARLADGGVRCASRSAPD
jgi:hypothetical protein